MRRRKLSLLDVTSERDAQYPMIRMRFTGEAKVWLLPRQDEVSTGQGLRAPSTPTLNDAGDTK